MRRLIVVFGAVFVILILVACGETSENQADRSAEPSESNLEEANNTNTDNSNNKSEKVLKDIGEVIVDDDILKATLINVELKVNDYNEEFYRINLELENKLSYQITYGVKEVFIDGKEEFVDGTTIDDGVLFDGAGFNEYVTGDEGEKFTLKMDIKNFGDIPEIKEELEFVLVLKEPGIPPLEEYEVKIEF